MTDMQKASACSVNGNPHVPTPFMDEMAASGVAFMDAYAPSSICTPSRASVFTGVHPLVHQVTCHQNRVPYNLPQLSELFMDAGYCTAVAGHYEVDRGLTRGWHEQVRSDEGGALGWAYRQWVTAGRRDVGWASGPLDHPAEEGHAHLLTSRVINVLDQIEAADSPFFLHVAYEEPHQPYFVPPPYDSIVDPSALQVPAVGSDEGRPVWQVLVRGQCGTQFATDADIKRLMAIYYGKIAYADAQMRRLYTALEQRGLLENTWIIIGSDHGDYLGEKDLVAKTESLYECLLHVPLIITPPRGVQAPRGEKLSGFVDLVDLFPTLLGIADLPVPEYAQGKDLLAWARAGGREPLRDCLFAQVGDYHGHLKTTWPSGMPAAGRHPGLLQGARTRHTSFVRDPDYGDEAYDLRHDPQELENLLGREGVEEPLEVGDLRRRVDQWEEECIRLRERLEIIPGYRGFDLDWMTKHGDRPR